MLSFTRSSLENGACCLEVGADLCFSLCRCPCCKCEVSCCMPWIFIGIFSFQVEKDLQSPPHCTEVLELLRWYIPGFSILGFYCLGGCKPKCFRGEAGNPNEKGSKESWQKKQGVVSPGTNRSACQKKNRVTADTNFIPTTSYILDLFYFHFLVAMSPNKNVQNFLNN